MHANLRRISPSSLNSQFSFPYERNQFSESSCHSYAKRTAIRFSLKAQSSFIEPIIQLLSPLPSKKRDDFRASFRELGPISPIGIGRVRQGDLFWVARIPAILGLPYLDDGGFTCERGKRGRLSDIWGSIGEIN